MSTFRLYNTKTILNSKSINNAKHSKTKPPWFSRLLCYSARKRGGLILYNAPEPTPFRVTWSHWL